MRNSGVICNRGGGSLQRKGAIFSRKGEVIYNRLSVEERVEWTFPGGGKSLATGEEVYCREGVIYNRGRGRVY